METEGILFFTEPYPTILTDVCVGLGLITGNSWLFGNFWLESGKVWIRFLRDDFFIKWKLDFMLTAPEIATFLKTF